MTTIAFQIVRYLKCCDGLRRETYRVRALFNHEPGTPESWRHWSSQEHATPSEAFSELSFARGQFKSHGGFKVRTVPGIPTVKTHTHIGEYGSPKRLRCDALD